MRYLRGMLLFCFAVASAAAVAAAMADRVRNAAVARQPEEIARPRGAQAAPHYHAVGVRSCAATACHGSAAPDPRSRGATASFIRRDEYIVWSDHDPHARSLRSLESDTGRAMLVRLGIRDAEGQLLDARGLNNCRACHASAITNAATGVVTHEAINCEACHGPAEAWVSTHFQRGWSRQGQGFVDLKNLETRGQACVACHVGDATREVNHDLIAAGHPVLRFELAAYHDLLPKHWRDDRQRAQTPEFELALWLAGQQATAHQALELTAARIEQQLSPATAAAPVPPVWPEFAEFDCVACHRDLAALEEPVPRIAAWNRWNLAQLDEEDAPLLKRLRSRLTPGLRVPDEALLADVRALQRDLAIRPLDVAGAADHWDLAAQAYLHLAAQFRARQDEARASGRPWPQEGALRSQLSELRRNLAFEPGYDGPTTTPAQRQQIADQLQSLSRQLSTGDR